MVKTARRSLLTAETMTSDVLIHLTNCPKPKDIQFTITEDKEQFLLCTETTSNLEWSFD